MPTIVLPVGMSMGLDYDKGDPGQRPSEYLEIHLGDGPVVVSADEAMAWSTAFADPEGHANYEVSRQRLEQTLRDNENGITEPEPVVSELLRRGLLVEFDPVEGPLEELFGMHQLLPLAQGYGNSPEDPYRYGIGFGGHVLVSVNADVYDMWAYSLTDPTLWDACGSLAEAANNDRGPTDEAVNTTSASVARDVAAALPILVATGCALFDQVNYAA